MDFEDLKIKWLWLTLVCSVTKSKVIKLISSFENIHNIFSASREDYEKLSFLKKEDIEKLCKKDLSAAREEYEKVKRAGAEIICYGEEFFPKALLCISNHPCVIYAKGIIKNLNTLSCFSVVGARVPDEYGKSSAYEISKKVASAGIAIVSGMADGIDSFSHMGALSAGGYTVAVLGSGVDVVYPKENLNLYNKILKSGMIISEYPISTRPDRFRFPERNKIIAALSLATLVVQAREKSGSLITADLAVKFGKKLFALPGNISSSLSKGTNLLLAKGASVVSCAEDVLGFYGKEATEEKKDTSILSTLSDEEKKIVSSLEFKGLNIDEICEKTGILISNLYSILLKMQLKGIIKKDSSEHYYLAIEV